MLEHGASNTQSLDTFDTLVMVCRLQLMVWRIGCYRGTKIKESSMQNKGGTLYASRASLLSEGTLPLEYFPLSTPDASGLQIVVPTMHIRPLLYEDTCSSWLQGSISLLKTSDAPQ